MVNSCAGGPLAGLERAKAQPYREGDAFEHGPVQLGKAVGGGQAEELGARVAVLAEALAG